MKGRSGCKCTTMQAYIEATISLGKSTWWNLYFLGTDPNFQMWHFEKNCFPVVSLHQMQCNHLKSNLLKILNRFSILNSCHIVTPLSHVTNVHPQLDYFYDSLTKGSAFYWMHSIWAMMYVFFIEHFWLFRNWEAHPKVYLSNQKNTMPWQKRVN